MKTFLATVCVLFVVGCQSVQPAVVKKEYLPVDWTLTTEHVSTCQYPPPPPKLVHD